MADLVLQNVIGLVEQFSKFPILDERPVKQPQIARLFKGTIILGVKEVVLVHQELKKPPHTVRIGLIGGSGQASFPISNSLSSHFGQNNLEIKKKKKKIKI
jgi:hypothetical protein